MNIAHLAPLPSSSPSAVIAWAAVVSSIAHQGQVDKAGAPYFQHPERVAAAVADRGNGDHVQIALAYLHDVVEDKKATFDDIRTTYAAAPGMSSAEVERLMAGLDALTARPHEPRVEYYERVKANPDALVVKPFDVEDNSDPVRLGVLDDSTRERLEAKYEKARLALGM